MTLLLRAGLLTFLALLSLSCGSEDCGSRRRLRHGRVEKVDGEDKLEMICRRGFASGGGNRMVKVEVECRRGVWVEADGGRRARCVRRKRVVNKNRMQSDEAAKGEEEWIPYGNDVV